MFCITDFINQYVYSVYMTKHHNAHCMTLVVVFYHSSLCRTLEYFFKANNETYTDGVWNCEWTTCTWKNPIWLSTCSCLQSALILISSIHCFNLFISLCNYEIKNRFVTLSSGKFIFFEVCLEMNFNRLSKAK